MFVKPPRMKTAEPSNVIVNGITISIVTHYNLLGVELDQNLDFCKFIAKICHQVNRKLYSIKRLFFLSTNVKLQFFKTFCLPYFDYCLSLCIDYSKTVLTKMHNFYYACLFKLFKFNFVNTSVSVINEFLKKYGLFAFQYRIFLKLTFFIFNAKQSTAAVGISNLLVLQHREVKWNLRNKLHFVKPISVNRHSDLQIDKFYVEWCNLTSISNFNINFIEFRHYILQNIDVFYTKFIIYFKQFNIINCCTYYYS